MTFVSKWSLIPVEYIDSKITIWPHDLMTSASFTCVGLHIYLKSTLLQEHVCYMLLEQYAFQIWSWTGLAIRILGPGAIPLKITRKLFLVHIFVHKFIWEPGAFYHPAGANLLFCSCYFKAWSWSIFDLENSSRLSMVKVHKSRPKSQKSFLWPLHMINKSYGGFKLPVCIINKYSKWHLESFNISTTRTWGGEFSHWLGIRICACLLRCFFVKFGIAINGFSSETKESKFKHWVYFEQKIVKSTQFGQNWVLFYRKRYTDGWVIGPEIGIEKVKFSRFGRLTHIRFWQKYPPPDQNP